MLLHHSICASGGCDLASMSCDEFSRKQLNPIVDIETMALACHPGIRGLGGPSFLLSRIMQKIAARS